MHNSANTLTEQSARGRSLRSTAMSPLQISSNTDIYCPAKQVPRGAKYSVRPTTKSNYTASAEFVSTAVLLTMRLLCHETT